MNDRPRSTAARLRFRLADFDGKALSLLTEAAAELGRAPDWLDALVDLAGDGEGHIADGATWLLKEALERGQRLDPAQTGRLIRSGLVPGPWQADLHRCQIVRHLQPDASHAATLAGWLKPLLAHPRPFLRAWAVDGLAALARLHPAHLPHARQALDAASSDPAGSVRARARNIKMPLD